MRTVAEGVLLNQCRDDVFVNHGGESVLIELEIENAAKSGADARVVVRKEGGTVTSAEHDVSPGTTVFFRFAIAEGGALRLDASGEHGKTPVAMRYRVSSAEA